MKAFGKWLVMATVNGKSRIAHPVFKTKKEAEITLASAGFKKVDENLWEDSLGQQFYIEKNKK